MVFEKGIRCCNCGTELPPDSEEYTMCTNCTQYQAIKEEIEAREIEEAREARRVKVTPITDTVAVTDTVTDWNDDWDDWDDDSNLVVGVWLETRTVKSKSHTTFRQLWEDFLTWKVSPDCNCSDLPIKCKRDFGHQLQCFGCVPAVRRIQGTYTKVYKNVSLRSV